MSALPNLDLAGTAVFALSGALVAAKARQTLLTFAFFAAITGVGGGTVRDLLIGAPVFWMHATTPIAVCLIMALLVWFTPRIFWPDRAIDWFDGIGLAAYGVYGAAKALAYGIPWLPAAIMGVVTACMGGIFRDVLAGVPSIVIRPELYVTAAALAAGSYVLLTTCGAADLFAALVAFALGFGLRGVAIWKGLALPTYRG
ncbi:trimeric intracellular cation channel family protein [Kozakia baliensis]|nr:trimeric intracellular cation channel family protein [Kozakia baliensis]